MVEDYHRGKLYWERATRTSRVAGKTYELLIPLHMSSLTSVRARLWNYSQTFYVSGGGSTKSRASAKWDLSPEFFQYSLGFRYRL
jgi:hypothetical protein